MNTRKLGIIIIIIAVICIIGGIILANLNKNDDDKIDIEISNKKEDIDPEQIEYQVEKVRDPTKFFTVENIIKTQIDENFEAKDMNLLDGFSVMSYAVKGKIDNKDAYFIVRLDVENKTYELEKVENNPKSIDEIDLKTNTQQIPYNNKNEFETKIVSDEEMCIIYLERFTKLELENAEEAYKLLDKDYKEKRFPEFELYQEYIEERANILENSVLSKYSVDDYDDYREYVMVDLNNNTYTIKAKGVMDYTIKLDNYTIKVENFENKYRMQDDKQKVATNVQMFVQMINNKDYQHAYELLDDIFKKNNFATLDEFKNYVKENFFENNLLTTKGEVREEGKNFSCKCTLLSDGSSIAEKKELTIIMQLKEGTDFVMSFSM